MPMLFDSDSPCVPRGVWRHAAGDLGGLCASRGRAEADVVVMRDPTEFRRMTHGAIPVAREYGIQPLAHVRDATTSLQDGDRVRVDATAGLVGILSRSEGTQ